MNEKTQKVLNAFNEGGLSSAIREIVYEFEYYNFLDGPDMIIDSSVLYELAEDLEKNESAS